MMRMHEKEPIGGKERFESAGIERGKLETRTKREERNKSAHASE
jgi:hypothetical protein